MIIKQCNNDASVQNAIGVRMAPQAQIPTNPSSGDVWFATDTGQLYVGSAGTAWPIGSGGASSNLDGGMFDPPVNSGTNSNFDGGIY